MAVLLRLARVDGRGTFGRLARRLLVDTQHQLSIVYTPLRLILLRTLERRRDHLLGLCVDDRAYGAEVPVMQSVDPTLNEALAPLGTATVVIPGSSPTAVFVAGFSAGSARLRSGQCYPSSHHERRFLPARPTSQYSAARTSRAEL